MKNGKKALVPKLRFPEFREDWASSPMSEIYSFKGNNSLSRDKLNYGEGSLRNIHYGDIHTKFSLHFRVDAESVPYINEGESHSAVRPENYCRPGDMVFADASEDMEDVGKAIEIIDTGDVPLVCGLHTILARPDAAGFTLGFGAYLFSSEATRKQIQHEAQGAKVLGLSASRLGNVKLHYPSSTKEQQKIADCLYSLDALIAAQADKIDALKTHKKGLMQQLFPREGETVPRLRFSEFQDAGEWEEIPLGRVVEIASGQVDPTKPPYCDSPHVGGENIESDTGAILNVRTAKELNLISGKYVFDESYILYSKIRPALNKVAKPDFKGICSADIYPIRPKTSQLLQDYLVCTLLTDEFLKYAKKHSDRGKIPKVNRDALMAYTPSLPVPAEQQKIAECLSSIDTLITAHTKKLDALKTHKKGLMQQLFPSPEAVGA
ncbi:MAG: restriction endonuclease subunit S [Magnetococcales bacterium]|nr:restriction endonuclease subunit S [Magnetococcales bacterium]